MREMGRVVDLYVFSGFLGSGKTTLLKKMLEHYYDKNIGVVVNEFGKEGFDGKRVNRNGVEMVEINNGSVFCSCLKGSFVDALISLAERDLDYLFVEGSGLSDPSNMDELLFILEKKLGSNPYAYRGSICIIDGVNFYDYFDLFVAIEKQVKSADSLIINKLDLMEKKEVEDLKEELKIMNPKANILTTSYCNIDFRQFEKMIRQEEPMEKSETVNTPEDRPRTYVLRTSYELEKEKLEKFLRAMSQDIVRIKGTVILQEGTYQLDVVGTQIDFMKMDHEENESKLVIIPRFGREVIRKIFHQWEKALPNVKMRLK